MASGQTGFNELPGVDIAASMISTATYMLQVAAQYNHHDVRAGAAGRNTRAHTGPERS